MKILSSEWGALSPYLIALIYPVKMTTQGDSRSFQPFGDFAVAAPISDANLEQSANWTSPFEQQTPDARFSTFSSLLHVGGLDSVLNALMKVAPGSQSVLGGAQEQLSSMTGRSSMTKLNSTQIYSGSPPLSISLTAHFRALKDPWKEVDRPVNQLMSWAFPEELAAAGIATNALNQMAAGGSISVDSVMRTIYPSVGPSIVGLRYKGKDFCPMVIERVSKPLDSPIDQNGQTIITSVQMTISSLTAIDRIDLKKFGFK